MAVTTEELFKNFNPNSHMMPIETTQESKDYLPVQWRLVWFRALCPQGVIKTEMIHLDMEVEYTENKKVWNPAKQKKEWMPVAEKGLAIFRAVVEDGKGGVATGTKSERKVDFPDFIEKAETGAIGRALAALGYGTQFTGDELNEGGRIADSPVDGKPEQQDAKKSILTPQMLKEDWAKAYKISPAQIEERWSKFKVWVLEKAIEDKDLKDHELALLNGRIEQQRRANSKAS